LPAKNQIPKPKNMPIIIAKIIDLIMLRWALIKSKKLTATSDSV
jgi:hypothetical protein